VRRLSSTLRSAVFRAVIVLALGFAGGPTAGRAQVVPPAPVVTEPATPEELTKPEAGVTQGTPSALGVSPSGAFLRAVAVPGWGHAAIGSSTRAGFYFFLQATAAYGLIRTRKRITEVRTRADFREATLRHDLAAQGVTEPTAISAALDGDEMFEDLSALTESRLQQQEDWAAMGIFLLFLSGADAYVSAHLKNFPTPLEFEAAPVGDGRMEVGIRIPIGS
jgi:hypothetical protein